MAWRVLLIQNPAKLAVEKSQLTLTNGDGHFTLPLEDITAIILETHQASLNSYVLAACQTHGIAVVTCDQTHMPNGLLLPFLPHSRASHVAHLQQTWSLPLRKRLWQKIVQAKITNQAACLDFAGASGGNRLRSMAATVSSGDAENKEAQAARFYWPALLGKNFRRQEGAENNTANAALNYGYAVVRAQVARAQVAYGLIPAFGLHHNNDLNAFNLTDDMMEVFRPFIDRLVFYLQQAGELPENEKLSKNARARLASIGHFPCVINGQIQTLANTAEKLAAMLVDSIRAKDAGALNLPELPQEDIWQKTLLGNEEGDE